MARQKASESKSKIERKKLFAVASKIKDYVREHGCYAGSDLPDTVSIRICTMLDEAIARAEANNRRTVRACDL